MNYTSIGKSTETIPVIGQGTFKFGEDPAEAKAEIEALRYGIENGLTLIDTAEGYANGGSERIVAEAISDCRNQVFVSTKVSPGNCSYQGVIDAAEGSLERLKTDYIDLYFQHWPSKEHAIEETMRGMAYLVDKGLVKYIGVSNYTPDILAEAQKALGSHMLSCNQVGYHLNDRRIENNVLPYCQENGITVMGYSPFGYAPELFGGLGFPHEGTEQRAALEKIGQKYEKTAYQVALNWLLRQEGFVTIPKAKSIEHIKSNLGALGWELSEEDLSLIDRFFPRPDEGMPLINY
ncbi:aldo/keto reductase [Pullulanibacillus sp. KACC 23026]|uniref:aldo/keto reductase n=1 Tax=Pullulanibacillus sp. KACC 23026 TaxID=3028315 RepID=UPI0023AFAE72|nr:aldo/keto reductase [Pullulanibacillus sp. KACC 23026]WEG13709.1 aldo/keto reductase [Pullulanibacillus sp. KACC 23026]